jgi:hypothetical protein
LKAHKVLQSGMMIEFDGTRINDAMQEHAEFHTEEFFSRLKNSHYAIMKRISILTKPIAAN